MRFGVEWDTHAVKKLEKLPHDLMGRILRKVDDSSLDPFRFLERLEGDPGYKLRVGSYRLIIDIVPSEHVLLIRDLDHRKRIYKQ